MSMDNELTVGKQREVSGTNASRSFQAPMNVSDWERMLSIAGGVALAVWGISRIPLRGFVAAGAAAGFLYRGYTGRCHAYAALNLDTRHSEQAVGVPAPAGTKIEPSRETGMPPLKSSGEP